MAPNDMIAQKVWYSVYNTPFTGGTVVYTVERGREKLTERVNCKGEGRRKAEGSETDGRTGW